jgi:hypothetical protein
METIRKRLQPLRDGSFGNPQGFPDLFVLLSPIPQRKSLLHLVFFVRVCGSTGPRSQMIAQFSGFSRLGNHPELRGIVQVWPAFDYERRAWIKIPRFYVLHENAIGVGVDLSQPPSRRKHRPNVARAS